MPIFQGFTEDSFRFLQELKLNSNKNWMDRNRQRYEDLKGRMIALIKDIADSYISIIHPALETRADNAHCLSRINRQRETPQGEMYYPYLWAAFYRKSTGGKSNDFQLFISMHSDRFELGIFFGAAVGESFKNKFREKVQAQKGTFIQLAQQLPGEFKFLLRGDVSAHDEPTETIRLSDESLQKWLDTQNMPIERAYASDSPTVYSSDLVDAVIEDFKKLDPIYQFIWSAYEQIPIKAPEKITPEDEFVRKLKEVLTHKSQVILYGPPGTGKTYTALEVAKFLTDESGGEYRLVQFHPSYSYEDFVEGIVTEVINGQPVYRIEPKLLRDISNKAMANRDKRYCIVIDEINRGSLPKIFGELLLALEYRDTPIMLPYSKTEFTLPENVLFIGTMNSLDRSIALVDYALRRRFYFLETMPNEDILESWLEDNSVTTKEKVLRLFEDINAMIRNHKKLSIHHQIGHTYFFVKDTDEMRRNWTYSILPLLQEYFFGDEAEVDQFLDKFNEHFGPTD